MDRFMGTPTPSNDSRMLVEIRICAAEFDCEDPVIEVWRDRARRDIIG